MTDFGLVLCVIVLAPCFFASIMFWIYIAMKHAKPNAAFSWKQKSNLWVIPIVLILIIQLLILYRIMGK